MLQSVRDEFRGLLPQSAFYSIEGALKREPLKATNSRIFSALDDWNRLVESFAKYQRSCLEYIYSNQIKPKSAAHLSTLSRDLVTFFKEGLWAPASEGESISTPLVGSIHFWQNIAVLFEALLEPNQQCIAIFYLRDLSKCLERCFIPPLTILPIQINLSQALSMERDLRRIINYFNDLTDYEARVPFEKILLMLNVLCQSDEKSAITAAIKSSADGEIMLQLDQAEISSLISTRIDWK